MGLDDTTVSDEQTAEMRAVQADKLGDQVMGPHQLAAYRAGFPPGNKCVATPEAFRAGLENGEIEIAFSPVSLAQQELDRTVGPQEKLGLGVAFATAKADPSIMPDADNTPDFTRSV